MQYVRSVMMQRVWSGVVCHVLASKQMMAYMHDRDGSDLVGHADLEQLRLGDGEHLLPLAAVVA